MKKIYLSPEMQVEHADSVESLMVGSLTKFDSEASSGGWVQEDHAWDIWGNAVTEE